LRNKQKLAIARPYGLVGYWLASQGKCSEKNGLTEAKALELESKLIHFFGSRFDSGNPGKLVNLATTAGPTLKPQKPPQLRDNKKL
jgi:hypothetical protein